MLRFAAVLCALVCLLFVSPALSPAQPGGPWGGLDLVYFDAIGGPGDMWTFVGYVEGAPPDFMWIELGGVTGPVDFIPVQFDGTFSYSMRIPLDASGEVSCQAHSLFAQFSNVRYDVVNP